MIINDPELGEFDLINPEKEVLSEMKDITTDPNTKPENRSFAEVQKKHKEVIKQLGIESAVEFNKMIEDGQIEKAQKYVESLPNSDPLKKDLLTLLEYV